MLSRSQDSSENGSPFLTDSDRTSEAGLALVQQFRETTINLNKNQKNALQGCLSVLSSCRESDLYKSIKEKLSAHEIVTASEYFYFAMTTDNVNTLDVYLLNEMSGYFKVAVFERHVDILIALRNWQDAKNAEIKSQYNAALRDALYKRFTQQTTPAHPTKQFLNLRGADFAGADLHSSFIFYADLEQANFTNATMAGMNIEDTNLDGANLTGAICQLKGLDGPHFRNTTARKAILDHIRSYNSSFRDSDFSEASIQHSTINGYFSYTCLRNANLNNSKLGFMAHYTGTSDCIVDDANMTNTKLFDVDFLRTDFSRANLMQPAAFVDAETLAPLITTISDEYRDYINTTNKNAEEKDYDMQFYHFALAQNIIYHINASSALTTQQKIDFLNTAIDHPAFQPASGYKQLVNYAERKLFNLFSGPSHHPIFETPALGKLENARDKLIAENESTARLA